MFFHRAFIRRIPAGDEQSRAMRFRVRGPRQSTGRHYELMVATTATEEDLH